MYTHNNAYILSTYVYNSKCVDVHKYTYVLSEIKVHIMTAQTNTNLLVTYLQPGKNAYILNYVHTYTHITHDRHTHTYIIRTYGIDVFIYSNVECINFLLLIYVHFIACLLIKYLVCMIHAVQK